MTYIPVTPTTNPDAIRSHLTRVLLAMFDMTLHAGLVPVATLFEGLNTSDAPATLSQQRRRIAWNARRLNARIALSGWRVVRIGRSNYEMQRVPRPGADDDLHRRVAALAARVADGIIAGSPQERKLRRDLAALCTVPALTVDGSAARDKLRELHVFAFHIDQARLRRAAVRDVGVFL